MIVIQFKERLQKKNKKKNSQNLNTQMEKGAKDNK